MSTTRRFSRLAAVLAAGSILVMGPAAGSALAHTEPVAFSPKKGATLSTAPQRVTITFGAEILGGSIVVRTGGRVVSKGPSGKDPKNVRRLRVSLKRGLGSGRYLVRWTVKAADGHSETGSYTFRVR
jgi:methionine-rich copper-binding protein CopC